MKRTFVFFIAALLVGCASHRDDLRLQGTWHSNRDATVAEAFRRDPRWTNAAPERVERFRDIFGHMTITYSNGVQTADYRGEVESFRYRVVNRGPDYVVIRSDGTMDKGRDIRIRFVDDGSGYWIDTGPLGFGLQERFDRVTRGTTKGELDGATNRSQPIRSETNRPAAAAGSGR